MFFRGYKYFFKGGMGAGGNKVGKIDIASQLGKTYQFRAPLTVVPILRSRLLYIDSRGNGSRAAESNVACVH